MFAEDFEYDGQTLGDLGFMVCDFNGGGLNTVSAGSNITFNQKPIHRGALHPKTSTQYDECLTTTFAICKSTCGDQGISAEECRALMCWLNRHEFLKFRFLYDALDTDPCYYDASFNVSRVEIDHVLYGLQLEMVSNRPYGYGDKVKQTLAMTSATTQYPAEYHSDEIGQIYPDVTITCQSAGDLLITNKRTGAITSIKGVSVGEVITMDGVTMQIKSSLSSHKLHDAFNYEFITLANTYSGTSIGAIENYFTANLSCKLEMIYTPVIKGAI